MGCFLPEDIGTRLSDGFAWDDARRVSSNLTPSSILRLPDPSPSLVRKSQFAWDKQYRSVASEVELAFACVIGSTSIISPFGWTTIPSAAPAAATTPMPNCLLIIVQFGLVGRQRVNHGSGNAKIPWGLGFPTVPTKVAGTLLSNRRARRAEVNKRNSKWPVNSDSTRCKNRHETAFLATS